MRNFRRSVFVFFFICLRAQAGISEQWAEFKTVLLQDYLPTDQKTLTQMWQGSVEHSSVHSSSSPYIRKHGANRIVTHYFLSQSITKLNLDQIRIAEKKVAILPNDATEGSFDVTRSLLQNEDFLQYHFLSTFEHYAKEKLPTSQRISFGSDAWKRYKDISLVVLAKRVSFGPVDKSFGVTHWEQLRDLVLATPFDLGWAPNLNFGLTSTGLVIFDTEPGAYRYGRDGMFNFANQYQWVAGQEAVVELVEQDINKWARAEKEESEGEAKQKAEQKLKAEEERTRQLEERAKRIAQKKSTDEPGFTSNALGDVVRFLEEGDCVVIRQIHGATAYDKVFYLKENTLDPEKIRFLIVDVTGTGLADEGEWPDFIKDHFGKRLNEEFTNTYLSYYKSSIDEKKGNIFHLQMPRLWQSQLSM